MEIRYIGNSGRQILRIGDFTYLPRARSVFTGKYTHTGKPPTNCRARRGDVSNFGRDLCKGTLQVVGKIVTGVVARTRYFGQWPYYLGALKHVFTAEHETLYDSLVGCRVARRHRGSPGPATPFASVVNVACDPQNG